MATSRDSALPTESIVEDASYASDSSYAVRGGEFMVRGGGFMVRGGGFMVRGGEFMGRNAAASEYQ